MAKKYELDDVRLCRMVEVSRWVLQKDREERMRVVRTLAGSRYSRNASMKKVYVNLNSLYRSVVRRNLISQDPRVMLSTFDRDQSATVDAAEAWTNHELVRQKFAATMGRLVDDALVGPMGIGWCALATPAESAASGWGLVAGKPMLNRIDLDDYVCHHRARDMEELQFEGHRFRVAKHLVMDNPDYDKKAKDHLYVSKETRYNREGDERIGQIWRTDETYDEDLEDMVDLWAIYLPQHRITKIFADCDIWGPTSAYETGKAVCLQEVPWIGSEKGPYPKLFYETIPGNLMPQGPMSHLVDLNEMVNETYRKLVRQSARFKANTICSRSNPQDGERMRTCNDGDTVPVDDPKSFQEVVQGGPNAGLFAWMKEGVDRFERMAGNLATLGGLASQAGTLGQEELLAQQSSGQIAAYQETTVAFVSDCADRMLWYFWHDPELVMQAPVNDPNLPDVKYVRQVHPWSHDDPNAMRRVGNKPDLKIDPYTMRHKTPQQRSKDILSFVTQVYVPLAQIAMQQGHSLDFAELARLIGKYWDEPDLQKLLGSYTQPPTQGDSPPSQGMGDTGPTKPPATERTYKRVSSGGARQAEMQQNNDLAAAMAGTGGSPMNGQKGY